MAHSETPFRRTRNSTFRAKIREELICAICLDFLQEPKVLSCAHSFCLACLKQIKQSKHKYANELQRGELECPSCRQSNKLPSGLVEELTTNYTLKRLVSVVSENEKRATRQLLSSRSQSISQTTINCPQHLRPVEFFCMDCSELLCPRCTSSTHRGHNFQDTDKVLPEQIKALRSLIQPACEVANRAEGMIEQLFQERETITLNADSTTKVIEAYFKKIRGVVDHRESALKSTIQKYRDVKLSRLDSHNQMLQNYHDTILVKVGELEQLIEDNDIPKLFVQKQAIAEELEAQEQSVMAVQDLMQESCNKGSLLFREGQSLSVFAEIGTLNERHQNPNSAFVTLRRVVVSEEEDPYLDVPLRFEDTTSSPPQKQVRVDESKSSIEYEPEEKSNIVYDIPRPLSSSPQLKTPEVPPRKSSSNRKEPTPPPLPPRPRSRRITPSSAKRPSNHDTDWTKEYQNFNPQSLTMLKSFPDITNRKMKTLPTSSHYNHSNSIPMMTKTLADSSDDSSEDYEPLNDWPLPQPRPRTKPPPLPSNHPSQAAPRPQPKPRKGSNEQISPILQPAVRPVLKKRSLTLPGDSMIVPPLPPKEVSDVMIPVKIIDNEMLCSQSGQDKVYPTGICCLTRLNNHFVVTDVYNHCLRVLDSNGVFLETIGTEGRAGGQFKEPSAVAVDSGNNLFVTERDNPRVQKFTSSGKYLTKFGQKTLLGSQLGDPTGIAISPDNSILVTDWDQNEIIKFKNGKLEKVGKENNLLKFPAGLALNHKGHILVSDRGNHCIWELTVDGDVVQRIGNKGQQPGQLYFPYGVLVLENQSIVVTESGNNRVSIFSENGKFIQCFGEKGSKPGQFDHPRHLCVDGLGRVVVVDQMNQRLQVFQVS